MTKVSDWSPPAGQLKREAAAYERLKDRAELMYEKIIALISPIDSEEAVLERVSQGTYHAFTSYPLLTEDEDEIVYQHKQAMKNDTEKQPSLPGLISNFSELWDDEPLPPQLMRTHGNRQGLIYYLMISITIASYSYISDLYADPDEPIECPEEEGVIEIESFSCDHVQDYSEKQLLFELGQFRPWKANELDYLFIDYLITGRSLDLYSFFRYVLKRVLSIPRPKRA